MIYTFKCLSCGRKHKDVICSRYTVHGEWFSARELDIKPCCKNSKLERYGVDQTADNSYQWNRAVEPHWIGGKDPGTRISDKWPDD